MRSILVHLDASPQAGARLAFAQRLAGRHGAEVTAWYGVLPPALSSPWSAGEGMAAAAALLSRVERQQRERARASFNSALRRGPILWLDGGSDPYRTLLTHAPYADLLVFGHTRVHDDLAGAQPPGLIADAISDTGRPALVLPADGVFEAVAERVLIAWKPTREAARAVRAALPSLRIASAIDVALHQEGDDDPEPARALVHWLRLQGVPAAPRMHALRDGDVGAALLGLGAELGSDLLVMGCYGHGRAREWILGGTSHSVLSAPTLPVMLVH